MRGESTRDRRCKSTDKPGDTLIQQMSGAAFLERVPESWLLAPKPISDGLPSHLRYSPSTDYDLFCSPHLPVASSLREDGCPAVWVLGQILDLQRPTDNAETVATRLAQIGRVGGGSAIARATEWLSGRFIILVFDHEESIALLDATGSRPAHWCPYKKSTILGSHPRLLAIVANKERDAKMEEFAASDTFNHGGRYFPGSRTLYTGVQFLSPNHVFDLRARSQYRFYPDQEAADRTLNWALLEVLEPMAIAYREYTRSNAVSVVQSLSGGLDSRLSLALSREVADDIIYFTYGGGAILDTDVLLAKHLARLLGLNHVTVSRSLEEWDAEELFLFAEDALLPIANRRNVARAVGESAVHLRSNVLEIGRGFYLKNPVNRRNSYTPAKLSRLFRRSTSDAFVQEFEDWALWVDLDSVINLGYHYTDFFYWEHRMSNWLGPMLRADAFIYNTIIPWNTRGILNAMLQLPIDSRIHADLFIELILKCWRETLDVPIFSGSRWMLEAHPNFRRAF